MKNFTTKISYLLLVPLLAGCCFLDGADCKCKEQASELADLLWNIGVSSDVKESTAGKVTYLLAGLVANKALSSCCDETKTAPGSNTKTRAFYSTSKPNPDIPSTWGREVTSADTSLPTLTPCDTKGYSLQADLLADGFYTFLAVLDSRNDVNERSEGNNESPSKPKTLALSSLEELIASNNASVTVIHVTTIAQDSITAQDLLNPVILK